MGWELRSLSSRRTTCLTLAVTERLGLEESGGMVRVEPVHYDPLEEIERFGDVLGGISASNV